MPPEWKVKAHFLGEEWTLMTSYESQLHSVKDDGTDCFKWYSESGRELVITINHILEIDPMRLGTYNYSNPIGLGNITHIINDIAPYYFNFKKNMLPKSEINEMILDNYGNVKSKIETEIISIQNSNMFQFLW